VADKLIKGLGYAGRIAGVAGGNPLSIYGETQNLLPFLPPISKIPVVGDLVKIQGKIQDKVIRKPIENLLRPRPRPTKPRPRPKRPPSKINPSRPNRTPLRKRGGRSVSKMGPSWFGAMPAGLVGLQLGTQRRTHPSQHRPQRPPKAQARRVATKYPSVLPGGLSRERLIHGLRAALGRGGWGG